MPLSTIVIERKVLFMSPQETGTFIAKLRKEAGITQQELAEKLNVTAKAVSRWETGKGYPDVTFLPEISKIFNVSVNEILNGNYFPKKDAVEIAEKTILTVCYQAKADKRRNLRLLITISIISAIIFCMLCVSVFFGIAQSLKGESYAVLTNDLSCLTYYGERYVPLNMNGYSCRLGEEIVDEIKLDGGSILDKLFSEYALQIVQGVSDNDLIYLRSEHDIDFYVKETKNEYYQELLNDFNPHSAYIVFEQPNGYEKELLVNEELFSHLIQLSDEDTVSNLTCEYLPNQQRMTVIAYDEKGVVYKEYGDIFVADNEFYWYNYENLEFPDSVANQQIPYKINDKYDETLKSLFSYYN